MKNFSKIRHDIKNLLTPALLLSDAFQNNANPEIRQDSKIISHAIMETINLLNQVE